MREIKFRAAWDNRVYPVTELMWSDGTAYLVHDDKNRESLVSMDDIELLQFTGLRDKNGTEIYEGDLISWLDRIGVVHFKQGEFLIKWDKGCDAFNERIRVHEHLEVVGNEFENPELIGSYPAAFKSEQEAQTHE